MTMLVGRIFDDSAVGWCFFCGAFAAAGSESALFGSERKQQLHQFAACND